MKQINVSVVGMSGTERDKGQIGVGKSCFCNRFVRPQTDDYFIDHISVLSQSDFSGRIVNNDHFLYWGDVRRTTDEGVDYQFHVVEQTEFVDDATFQPFKVGKMEPYIKRATALKVLSAEKLMYICKNQLGIEREYEQRVIPDGRLAIDGFICLFDVSPVPNRSVEKQVEYVHQLIATILKNKKPVLLVTTKNDEANELFVREAEKICQRKEYKGSLYMVETSAHDAINVDTAFILLAQLIDKTKARTKITTYADASRSRKELLDISSEQVTRLIRQQITDYHTTWSQASKMLSHNKEWVEFLDLFSAETGQRIFRRHIKKLREENVSRRLHTYMDNFGAVLPDLVPDLSTVQLEIEAGDWNAVRAFIKAHVEYEQYFFECDQAPWTDLSDVSECEDEARIPFDVLATADAETVFRNHVNALQQEQKRLEWKKQFKKLLEEAGFVTPGKQLSEVRVLFMGRECFEALSEHDCQQIYDNHQKEIVDRAKHNFLELLLEHADLFYHFKSIEPSGTITQEDVKDITNVLQDDVRYKMLDRLDQDRKLMLFQHLGFVHCPIREHCPAFPNCIDGVIERIISARRTHSLSKKAAAAAAAGTASRSARPRWKAPPPPPSLPPSLAHAGGGGVGGGGGGGGSDNVLNLLILGSEHLASDVVNEICLNCGDDGEYIYDGQPYYLNQRIVNGDLDSFKQLDLAGSGLVCVYSNQQSSEFLRDSLERSLLLELEDRFESLPLVLVYQPEDQKDDQENELQRTEGQHLADMLHCLFIDTSLNFYHHRQSQHQNYIYDILNHLIECVRLKQQLQQQMHHQQQQLMHHAVDDEDDDDEAADDDLDDLDDLDDADDADDMMDDMMDDAADDGMNDDDYRRQQQRRQHRRQRRHRRRHGADTQPDIRIILCMFCGDPFSVEAVLQPILAEPTCQLTGDRSVIFETFLGDTKRRIEVIMSSYHGANAFRDELVHGFILLYSTKRRASLATLNAFSMNIPNLPMQLLAITDNGGASAFFTNDVCQMLITEGNAVADKLRAHFMTSPIGNQLKFAFYTPFLKEVWDKKPEIEQAFHMEEPVTLDSGEGTLEHSMHHLPQPPPRHESYMLKHNTAGTDGSGSENYEHLPTRSLNSLNGEKDMGIDDTYMHDEDKDDKARLMHQGFQIYPPPTTPPEPAPPDHLHHLHPMATSASMLRSTGVVSGGGGGGGGCAPPYKGSVASGGQHHQHAHLVSASQSSLDDITSDVSGSKDSLTTHDSGWIDDGVFMQKDGSGGSRGRNMVWNNFGGNTPHHAFTTGRPHPQRSLDGGSATGGSGSGMSGGFAPNKVRPKGPSQTLKMINPGKLNLKNFAIVNEAIARMTVTDGQQQSGTATGGQLQAEGDHLRRPAPTPAQRHHNTLMAGGSGGSRGGGGGGRPLPTAAARQQQRPQFATVAPGRTDGRPAPTQTRSKSNGSLFFAPTPHYAAPLAAADLGDSDDDDLAEYAQVKEVYEGGGGGGGGMDAGQPLPLSGMYTFPHDGHHGATTPNKHQQQQLMQQQQQGKLATRHRRDVNKKYSDSDSESSSSERQNARGFDGYYKMNRASKPPATHKRMRKKRTAIPVQPPKVPPSVFGAGSVGIGGIGGIGGGGGGGTYVSPPEIPMQMYQKMKTAASASTLADKQRLVGSGTGSGSVDKMLAAGKQMYGDVHEEESSIDISSPRDNNSPLFGVVPKALGKGESDREKLIGDRKREKAEEKLDKRRAKEDAKMRKLIDKEREAEKKAKRKSKQTTGGKGGEPTGAGGSIISDFVQSEKNFVPLFLERCVEFIEQEGLDSEGIYRVPGNRAHVDLLYQKLQEDANIDIDALDIPVNAVATGLKDFFSKHLPSLFDADLMTELEEIASCITSRSGAPSSTLNMEVKTDRSCRLLALRSLLNKLPAINFSILKYIFAHFVRVSENSKLNSMDSKNLAICWWPTLIPIEFTDMGHFEQLRPYLEDIVQTMIDQFPFLFCGKEAFVMV